MARYLVVVEDTDTGYSAFSPDLPGCVATGNTREEVEQAMREAVEFHLDGIRDDGDSIPAPHCYSTYCDIPA
jgi:predicted RNase H-like HicB family nuclease